jgi:hypothetical protein
VRLDEYVERRIEFEKNGSQAQRSRPACSQCVDQRTNANIKYREMK